MFDAPFKKLWSIRGMENKYWLTDLRISKRTEVPSKRGHFSLRGKERVVEFH
jgi:hypothetical protein